jgi:hypothetical protein
MVSGCGMTNRFATAQSIRVCPPGLNLRALRDCGLIISRFDAALTASPPTEQGATSEDKAVEASTGDGTGNWRWRWR